MAILKPPPLSLILNFKHHFSLIFALNLIVLLNILLIANNKSSVFCSPNHDDDDNRMSTIAGSLLDKNSYSYNLRQYQRQHNLDNFITSENFNTHHDNNNRQKSSLPTFSSFSEFDSIKSSPSSTFLFPSTSYNNNGQIFDDSSSLKRHEHYMDESSVKIPQRRLKSPTQNAKSSKDDPIAGESSELVKNRIALSKCEYYLQTPTTGSSNFTSFGYPDSYPKNLNCIYRITRSDPSVCKLELKFLDFDLDSQNEDESEANNKKVEAEFGVPRSDPAACKTDYLEFNDRKRFCGDGWKGRVETVEIDQQEVDSEFIFRFISTPNSMSNQSKGFLIEYSPIVNSCTPNSKNSFTKTSTFQMREKLKNSSSNQQFPTVQMLASASSSTPACEHRHSEMEFDIKSDGFPKRNYSNNLDCVHYVIRESEKVCGLELRFISFQLEPSEGCAYDFLEIDGESFCGKLPDGSRNIFKFSSQETKTISFQTDSQGSAPGFHIRVRQLKDCDNTFIPVENQLTSGALKTQKCNFVSSECDARMTSVKHPKPYPDDIICAYTIEKPKGTGKNYCSVQLTFTEFDLQQSDDCSEDFLELENQRYCGKSLNGTSKIVQFNEDGFVKFMFKSDSTGSTESRGFAMNYTQIECLEGRNNDNKSITNKQNPKPIGTLAPEDEAKDNRISNNSFFYRDPCFKVFEQKRFTITTDLVNGTYKENMDCLYTIRKAKPKVCYLEMQFRKFDLEASPDCQYDYVEIGSAVRLCGTLQKETSRIYRFNDQEMFVTFHTDASTERSGFVLEVEQLECEGDRIVRETGESSDQTTTTAKPKSKPKEKEPKDGLQSLEQNESRKHITRPKDSQIILQQQETASSEFDLFDGGQKSRFQNADFYCSKIFEEKEFFVHSPGYPAHYQPDQDCLYMIRPYRPTVCKIEVNFDQFELQPYDFSKNCMKSDFLDIDSREQLCGKMPEAQSKMFTFLNQSFFIHFHSDSFKTSFDKGFRLFVRQIDCDSGFSVPQIPNLPKVNPTPNFSRCNKIFTGSAFELKSPLYPTTYLSNSYCQYRVMKLRSDNFKICYLEVNFHDFELQDSQNCSKDFLSLNGVKLCGSVAKDSVRLFPFYENEFLITFSTDRIINGRGFHLQIRQNECPSGQLPEDFPSPVKRPPSSFPIPQRPGGSGFFSNYQILQTNQICQQTFGSMIFEIESPNYPNYYLPSLSCSYSIRKRNPKICQLELYFVDLDVEPSIGCHQDYLLIDGIKYCNINRPNTGMLQIPFYELEKRILFRSSEFRGRKGFMIQARQIDCTQQKPFISSNDILPPQLPLQEGIFPPEKFIFLPSLPSICEICVTEVTGNLQSYDYPNFYPPNVNCTYRITPLPDNCMVQMRFDEFDFDYSPECTRDFLEINGVRYCGNQLKGVSMILLNKRKENLSIRMISHSRGAIVKPSFRGFRGSYTQLPCLGTSGDPKQPKPTPRPSPSRPSRPEPLPPTKTIPQTHEPEPVASNNASIPSDPTDGHDQIYCDQKYDAERFDIKSPGFPYRYFDNLNCLYQIEKSSASVCRLRLTFNYFNIVGEDGQCRGDFLEVFNSKICGVLERYTKKEIPFLQEKVLLNFHTNSARTSNGFHLVVEQIDCIHGGPVHPDPYETLTKIHSRDPAPRIRPPPSHFVLQQQRQEMLKYDDDDIVSEFDQSKKSFSRTPSPTSSTAPSTMMTYPSTMTTTSTTTTTTTRRPVTVGVQPHVDYEPEEKMNPFSPLPTKSPSTEAPSTYPLRYFSRNITVLNGKGKSTHPNAHGSRTQAPVSTTRFEQQRWDVKGASGDSVDNHENPDNQENRQSTICDQTILDQMYFELSSRDLRLEASNANSGSRAASCQLRIRKARPNICQLDIHFMKYWMNNDTSCGQQYLSVDGERICGFVPANTIKKFWFVRPDLYLFVKLLKEQGQSDEFAIKARQVECAHNLDQQQSNSDMQVKLPDQMKPKKPQETQLKSPKDRYSSFYEQQQLLDRSDSDHEDPIPQIQVPFNPKMDPRDKKPDPQVEEKEFNNYCDLIATEPQYKIVSPRSPGAHKCRYTIRKQGPKVCAIDVKFQMFRLEEQTPEMMNQRCKNEYMEIDSGKICGAFPVGHERRYHFMPDEQEKMIYFYSNRSNQVPGDFVLDVKQIEDCTKSLTQKPTLTMPTICDMSSQNVRGQLKSPNYPAPYDDFTRCTYRILAASPDYCNLKLVIRDMDIEKQMNPNRMIEECDKDSLELVSNGIKLCGREVTKHEYIIPFESMNGQRMTQLKFTSDSTGNGRGFSLDYSQELCVDKMDNRGQQSDSIKSQSGFRGGIRFVPSSPAAVSASKGQMYMTSSTADANSLGRNPMRPNYPPNYVSKAHLLKSMDRQQFIKLMLMEEEKDKMRMNINATEEPKPSSSSTTEKPEIPSSTIKPRPITTTTTVSSTTIPDEMSIIEDQMVTTMSPMVTTTMSTDLMVETTTTSNSTNMEISMV